jgi:signal transduction histidine kinase
MNPQKAAFCGKLELDFRVYDRDKDSSLEKREALKILDDHHGIGVYRYGFRIRPLGDPGYDWLELDKKRIQQPAVRIGSNQVIGSVYIQSEEESHLEEKSARDGLKENQYFEGLKIICIQVLQKLQEKRFNYRERAHLGRRKKPLEQQIRDVFEEGDIKTKQKLDKEFDELGIASEKRATFYKLIDRQNTQKLKFVEELGEKVAIYQGQATLGKVVNVVLHEGRSPLSIIRNETATLNDYGRIILKKFSQDLIAKIAKSCEKIAEQAKRLGDLFRKIDPLAAKKRSSRKEFDVLTVIKDTFTAFESEMSISNISYYLSWPKDVKFNGWKEDFMAVFTNLIDNSIYWLNTSVKESKEIKVTGYIEGNRFIIDFIDNGPGIEKELIENDIIFEPGFSRKPEGGYGLGLAIAGEAIARNDGQLEAIYSEAGAFFRITLKGENVHAIE